jgi:hypothetical protein
MVLQATGTAGKEAEEIIIFDAPWSNNRFFLEDVFLCRLTDRFLHNYNSQKR